ncbi:MAG: murein biosynthesis integral membrane protein MurJ [Candidatus Paceibacterota bacterium]
MERIWRIFTREYTSISQAAILLGILTLFSQILGLFRDRAIAHFIGPGAELDAYYAAFRIPDLIFISLASLASVTVLVPFIVSRMNNGVVTDEARKFLNDIFTVFFFSITIISFVVFLFIPQLVHFVAPGFSIEVQESVISLSRILLLSPILMGLSNLFGSVTQLFRKFFIYSLSPIFYNLGILFGVMILYPIFGIEGLAIGVILGAFMHFLVQLLSSIGSGFPLFFSFKIDYKEIKKVVLISLPRTMGLAFNNIALISIIALASFFKSGSVSLFNLSFNLQSVPLNIIGISYAVAAFPTLARSVSMGKLDEFKEHLKSSARSIVFWSLPIAFLFIVLRAQIVRVILGSGSFSWENTRLVAASLAIFSVSVLAQGMVALLSRAYYAHGNTTKPLLVNLFSSISIIIFAFVFNNLFQDSIMFRYFIESLLKVEDIGGTEMLVLPMAYSLGSIINFIVQWILIKRDFLMKEDFIGKTFLQSLGASFFLSVVTYSSLNILAPIFGNTTFWGVFLSGFISGIFGIITFVLVLFLLKNEELIDLVKTLKTKFWKTKVVVPENVEL